MCSNISLEKNHTYLILGGFLNAISYDSFCTCNFSIPIDYNDPTDYHIYFQKPNRTSMTSGGGTSIISVIEVYQDITFDMNMYNYIEQDYNVMWELCVIRLK